MKICGILYQTATQYVLQSVTRWLDSIVHIIDVFAVVVQAWLTGATYVPRVTNEQWLKDIYIDLL